MEALISSAIKGLIVTIALCGAVACAVRTRTQADPELAQPTLMQRLQEAEIADRGNATSFSWSAPGLDIYYDRKADEVADIIGRLQAGQEVPPDEINRALDTSEATTFGVPEY